MSICHFLYVMVGCFLLSTYEFLRIKNRVFTVFLRAREKNERKRYSEKIIPFHIQKHQQSVRWKYGWGEKNMSVQEKAIKILNTNFVKMENEHRILLILFIQGRLNTHSTKYKYNFTRTKNLRPNQSITYFMLFCCSCIIFSTQYGKHNTRFQNI